MATKRLLAFAFVLALICGSNIVKASDLSNFLGKVAKAAQPTPLPAPTPAYKTVWVQIVNAMVAPSKADGSKWHGVGKVNPQIAKSLATVLIGSNPATGALALLSGPMVASMNLEKPTPYGWVEVAVNGEFQQNLQRCFFSPCYAGMKHTCTPIFSGTEYQNVPLNDGTRFKITLMDKHIIDNNGSPIGVAEINSKDLETALAAQKVCQISVADQTQNQFLFVGIEVREKK